MPELPEVETVVQSLKLKLIGETIKNIQVNYPKMMDESTRLALMNESILDIKRLGKYIIFVLNHYDLVSHLRMEGKYFFKDKEEPFSKHEHIVFYLSSGITLRYHDTRKFGTFNLKEKKDTYLTPPLSNLGDEPFNLDEIKFYQDLKKKNVPIKTALLDQRLVAGIGNIYADEILFASRINPHKSTASITKIEVKNIHYNAINILADAIKAGGTTIRTYHNAFGIDGLFQLNLKVHQRESQPCCICNHMIKRDVIHGRSSFYCPYCQKR